MFQRLDLPLAHQRCQLQRQTSAAHHFVHGGGKGHGQPHSAAFGACADADPPAFGNCPEAFGESGRGTHDAVFQDRRVQITVALQRGQNIGAQTASFGQNGTGDIFAGFGKTIRLSKLIEFNDMIQDEAILVHGRSERHRGSP